MPVIPLILWLLLLWALAPLAFPLARRVFVVGPGWPGLSTGLSTGLSGDAWPDGGWAAGRMLALVLWTLAAFWAGHLGLPVRLGWLLLLPALGLSAWAWARGGAELRAELRARSRAIVRVEVAFLIVFAAFLMLRCLWPDINDGEKPMDMALASAVARADSLPPANPYMAGTRLGGYYYLGHLQAALLTTTIGSSLRWSYDLCCATLPALAASMAWPLAALLCASWKRGGLAALILLGAGTLEPLRQWAEPNEAGFRAWPLSSWAYRSLDYFSTSRVIPNPMHEGAGVVYAINEYPFFTSTYGDLHAHFFAQPIALLAMSLGVALFFNRRAPHDPERAAEQAAEPASVRPERLHLPLTLTLGRVLLFACVLAGLAITNTWDVPAYWMLLALCLFAPCGGGAQDRLAHPPRPRAQSRATERSQVLEAQLPLSKSARRRQRRAQEAALQAAREAGAPSSEASKASEAARQMLSQAPSACLPSFVLWQRLGLATVLMALLALPYARNLHTNAVPPTPLDLPATPPLSWLLMWGPFAVAWSLALWRAWHEDEEVAFRFNALWLLAPVCCWLALKLAPAGSHTFNWIRAQSPGSELPYTVTLSWGRSAVGADYFAPIFLLTLIVLSLRGAFRLRDTRLALLCRLAVCGLVPMLWSELTWAGFLDRSLSGLTFHRQDTVFKFGLQGWLLFGLASIAASLGPRYVESRSVNDSSTCDEAVPIYRGAWRAWPWPVRGAFGLALCVMFVSSAMCIWGRGLVKASASLAQTRDEKDDFKARASKMLGTIHAPDAWGHLAPPEQQAALWMSQRAHDGDSLLEADQQPNGDSDYTPVLRYAHATGIPSVIGPQSHTFQWGSGKLDAAAMWEIVPRRKAQVQATFRSDGAALRDSTWRAQWKQEFGLRFIVLGELERQEFGDPAVDAMIAAAPSTRMFGDGGDPHRVVVVDLSA